MKWNSFFIPCDLVMLCEVRSNPTFMAESRSQCCIFTLTEQTPWYLNRVRASQVDFVVNVDAFSLR